MTRFVHGMVIVTCLLLCPNLMAQEPGEGEAAPKAKRARSNVVEPDEPQDINYLPKPFRDLRTNILDVQKSGYFEIDDVAIRTRGNGDESIVWTVRVLKAVTCRHVEALLREHRDARFYSTLENQRLDVIATLVQYSDRVVLGSSSGDLLKQDDVFEMWIDLPDLYYRKLKSLHADTLVLRRWKY